MLDDMKVLRQRDPANTLRIAEELPQQMTQEVTVEGGQVLLPFRQVVLAGMGGSALAADMVRVLTQGWLHIPVAVIRGYELPGYVGAETLVIAISHSGNTEETLACYQQARRCGATVAVLATGGSLLQQALDDGVTHVVVPTGAQPRMSTVYHLRGLLKLLQHFGIMDDDLYCQVADCQQWLASQLSTWAPAIEEQHNIAKQLARALIGKTPVFYGGELTWPLAYKWKISWNETAKNVAFCNQYPEFNHNEFIGWSSHPVEKPFAIIDLRSHLERPRIRERMELSDRLLSGKRPQASVIELQGDTLMQQLLWGLALADMASVYTALLNGVDPEPVALVERLKQELAR